MNKYAKIFIALFCVLLSISILLSAAYLVHNTMHDCIGEGCQICHAISVHKDILNIICLCYGTIVFALKLLQFAFYLNSLAGSAKKGSCLIANKVKITC